MKDPNRILPIVYGQLQLASATLTHEFPELDGTPRPKDLPHDLGNLLDRIDAVAEDIKNYAMTAGVLEPSALIV